MHTKPSNFKDWIPAMITVTLFSGEKKIIIKNNLNKQKQDPWQIFTGADV